MSKEIPLNKGYVAIVDAEDYEALNAFKWCVRVNKSGNRYAVRAGGQIMHRVIMDAPKGVLVDHINGSGLDNRRDNLRLCTIAENNRNSGGKSRRANPHIRFKGVFPSRGGKYMAIISVDNKDLPLGRFATQEAAAIAYNSAALLYYGEFARLNDVDLSFALPPLLHKINRQSKNSKFPYKGIYAAYPDGRVSVYFNEQRLGVFPTMEAGALAWNVEAVKKWGDEAILNDVDPSLARPRLPSNRRRGPGGYGYKGIYNVRDKGRACARIIHNGKQIHLGTFATIELAVHAYNEAAIKYHGDKAILNVIPVVG